MALKSTIFKVHVNIADMDRNHFADYSLTLARHPSETDERLMVRLLAFCINASESLSFTKGLSTEHEPDLWQKDLTDQVEVWVDVGLPSVDRIRKACHQAQQVKVYTYGTRTAPVWWDSTHNKVTKFNNLEVYYLPQSQQLGELLERGMHLHVTIQDNEVWFNADHGDVTLTIDTWMKPEAS